jgi:hypothetical protein
MAIIANALEKKDFSHGFYHPKVNEVPIGYLQLQGDVIFAVMANSQLPFFKQAHQ